VRSKGLNSCNLVLVHTSWASSSPTTILIRFGRNAIHAHVVDVCDLSDHFRRISVCTPPVGWIGCLLVRTCAGARAYKWGSKLTYSASLSNGLVRSLARSTSSGLIAIRRACITTAVLASVPAPWRHAHVRSQRRCLRCDWEQINATTAATSLPDRSAGARSVRPDQDGGAEQPCPRRRHTGRPEECAVDDEELINATLRAPDLGRAGTQATQQPPP